jgi:hypothetical protein
MYRVPWRRRLKFKAEKTPLFGEESCEFWRTLRPVRLDERDLTGGEVVHRTDDVDLLAGVTLLDDRR